MNHYETLGIPNDATDDQIRSAWRAKAKSHHPDKGGNTEVMASINIAYSVLSDADRRARYDETGEDAEQNSEAQEARNLLIRGFTDMVQRKIKYGRIAHVRNGLVEAQDRCNTQIANTRAEIEALQRDKDSITTSDEYNAYNAVLDMCIKNGETQIAALERNLQIVRLAMEMLQSYESQRPEVEPAAPYPLNQYFVRHDSGFGRSGGMFP
jgi:curved DNA-binding protein CbpA